MAEIQWTTWASGSWDLDILPKLDFKIFRFRWVNFLRHGFSGYMELFPMFFVLVVSDFTLKVGKGVILLVAAPVALTVFFIPYGLYAGRIFWGMNCWQVHRWLMGWCMIRLRGWSGFGFGASLAPWLFAMAMSQKYTCFYIFVYITC